LPGGYIFAPIADWFGLPDDGTGGEKATLNTRRTRRNKMAISGKYGKMEIPKIREDEPVFILRAQDILATGMVEIYKVIAGIHDSSLTVDLDKEIERFRTWAGERKMPD
jgi:hypothetical protein